MIILSILFTGKLVCFEKELAPDYSAATVFLESRKETFNEVFKDEDREDKMIMISVVFPEIVRYSLVRDIVETSSLELLYVRKGARFVDFSIGRFQMKPSFIESIEKVVKNADTLKKQFPAIIRYSSDKQQAMRQERVRRLQSLHWQLVYLKAFYNIVGMRHPFLQQKPLSYRVRFYATAYNHGFFASRNEIEQWMDKKTYPYGTGVKGVQFAYSRVADYFLTNHFELIFNPK